MVPVTASVAVRAAELRARHPALRTPDAIHLATAIESSAATFVTGDRRLASVPIGLPVVLVGAWDPDSDFTSE